MTQLYLHFVHFSFLEDKSAKQKFKNINQCKQKFEGIRVVQYSQSKRGTLNCKLVQLNWNNSVVPTSKSDGLAYQRVYLVQNAESFYSTEECQMEWKTSSIRSMFWDYSKPKRYHLLHLSKDYCNHNVSIQFLSRPVRFSSMGNSQLYQAFPSVEWKSGTFIILCSGSSTNQIGIETYWVGVNAGCSNFFLQQNFTWKFWKPYLE